MNEGNANMLDDVVVLDLGQIYNGSYCGLILSYMGAEVIKIEPPFGDPLRSRVEDGEPEEFIMLNSNKKGVTLNLKAKRGKEILEEMVESADILLENFSTGTMEDLGVGYDHLSDINPELIYAHSSGFGDTGPRRDQLAMDLIIQGVSGIMDITGEPDGPPLKTGAAIGDFLGGSHLVSGVLGALYHRERTGEGQYLEVSMNDAVYPSLMSQLASYYRDENTINRTSNRHSGLSKAPYNAYETEDGYIVIICANNKHWERLLDLMDRPDLNGDERFVDNVSRVENIDEVDEIVERWTSDKNASELEVTLREAGIPCGKVQTVEEVLCDRHLIERGMINEIYHPDYGTIKVPGMPIHLSESEPPDPTPSPTMGEDNTDVMCDLLGYTKDEVERLEEAGIL